MTRLRNAVCVLVALMGVSTGARADNGGTWYGGNGGTQYLGTNGQRNFYAFSARQGTFVEGAQFRYNGWNDQHTLWTDVWSKWFGGSGTANRFTACDRDNGYYMTGIHGRAGAFLDTLSIYCSKWENHAFETNPGWEPGTGGTEFTDRCTTNGHVVNRIDIRAGAYIDAIRIWCGPRSFYQP